jgi:PAS domain-containing protein
MLETNASAQPAVPDFRILFESAPALSLVLSPDLTIVAASDTYLHATGAVRVEVVGRGLFDVLLDDPDEPNAGGSSDLRDSLARVLRDRVPDAPPVLKYELRRPASPGLGTIAGAGARAGAGERYRSARNTPHL